MNEDEVLAVIHDARCPGPPYCDCAEGLGPLSMPGYLALRHGRPRLRIEVLALIEGFIQWP